MRFSSKTVFFVSIILSSIFACAVTFGQDKQELSLKEKSDNGIPYLSGGVTLDEREALAASGGKYNLKLVFAGKSGEYLADIKVEISDVKGKKILSADSEGPWFFTTLPAGKYNVKATMKDITKQSKITIKKSGKQSAIRFYW